MKLIPFQAENMSSTSCYSIRMGCKKSVSVFFFTYKDEQEEESEPAIS